MENIIDLTLFTNSTSFPIAFLIFIRNEDVRLSLFHIDAWCFWRHGITGINRSTTNNQSERSLTLFRFFWKFDNTTRLV